MRRVNYSYVLAMIVLLLFLTSCGSPYRLTKPNEVLTNKDISFVVPNTQFQIDKEYSSPKDSIHNRQLYLIDFNKKGMQFKMYTSGFGKSSNKYFKRNSYYDDSDIS